MAHGTLPDHWFCVACFDLLAAAWVPLAIRAGEMDRHYQRLYGVSLEQYGEMFVRQQGRCAICRREHGALPDHGLLVVDHDHSTGKVRGLLCATCNTAIGLLHDDPSAALAAAKYLIK